MRVFPRIDIDSIQAHLCTNSIKQNENDERAEQNDELEKKKLI